MGNRRERLPTPDEHARLWKGLPVADRRRLLRQVRRGQPAENRPDARIAVGLARQQQRYWRYAWLFGPAVAVVFSGSLVEAAALAALGAVVMGALSIFSYRRARAAEHANLVLLNLTPE